MKKFFENIWTKRVVSLLSGLYAFGVCYICYCSIFYDIEIASRASLCLLVSGISLFSLVVMLYTRKQFLTKLTSVIILPAMLPVVLFYFGEWAFIIPIIVTGVMILLLSGAGEGFKTAFGTIFLLMYVFGALGYFLFTSFFVTSAKTTVVAAGVSPTQQYRYEVINTEDSSNGSTAVYVEPNYADLHYPFVTLTLKNMERVVHLERPINPNVDVQWTVKTRQEITQELNALSQSIIVHLPESQLEQLGYTYDSKLALTELTMSQKRLIGLTASDVEDVFLDTLTAEQLAQFGIGKSAEGRYYVLEPETELLESMKKEPGEIVYFNEMNSDWQAEYSVTKDDGVLLSSLTDEQLAMLGVPESGDVMTFNGETCFRFYVAEIESYFNVNDRTLSISLLS